ncbi:MAG: hypothetical protein WDO13_12935 [Verrucomicrobiota bacterium]
MLATAYLGSTLALSAADKLSQPVAPVRPVTDTYFGTQVTDNYPLDGGPEVRPRCRPG